MKKLNKTLQLMTKGLFYGIITTVIFSGTLIAGNSDAQNIEQVKISLNLNQVSLPEVFSAIEDRTGFLFSYDKTLITAWSDQLSLKVTNQSVASILQKVSKETSLSFKQIGENIVVKRVPPPIGKQLKVEVIEERQVTGKVTGEDNIPLPGASVLLKGTDKGTITDNDGNYSILVPDQGGTLVIAFIGYISQEIEVGSRNIINIELVPDITQLEDIVVVGYGEQSRKTLTSSIAKVTAKDIENLPVTSFDQALQGQAAGVHIASSSGAPGSAVVIRIRGETSINAGNEPLFVIDGTPIVSGGLVGQNQSFTGQLNILSGINPEDIASMEVLKDAAATAIYGSRGANGVVLITTKKGEQGKSKITLDVYSGVGEPTGLFNMLNTDEYLEIKREAFENDGLPVPDHLANADETINMDWQDEIYRNARLNQYQLSMSGGSKSTTFYLSGSYRNEEALVLNSGLERGTFRLNIDHNASGRLSIGARIGLSRDRNNIFVRNGGLSGPVVAALQARPDVPVFDGLGEYTTPVILFGTVGHNPVEELLVPKNDNFTTKILSSGYLNYDISPVLDFRLDASYEYNIFQQELFYPSTTFLGSFTRGFGRFALNQTSTYNIEPTLKFDKYYGSLHHINVTVGATIMDRTTNIANIGGSNFIDDDLQFLISAGQIDNSPTTQTLREEYAFNSLFGRINYNYDSKYLLGMTLRRDGSARFGSDNRYGTFWAVSGGWLFSDESFLANSQVLTFGKLRASYGVTGNDQLPDFENLNRYTVVPGYGGRPGLAETQLGNPELQWEETAKFDIGLELSFFNDRISIETDYFINQTSNLLLSRPVARMTGFRNVISNIGETENKGFEFSLNTVNITRGEFSWQSRLNLTTLRNRIISLVDDEPLLTGTGGYFVGQPINVIRTLDFQGVNAETGDAIYRDVNGDGNINFIDDAVVVGNSLPEFFGGLNNTFSWNGLSLDIFLQFVNDADIYDSQASSTYLSGGVNQNNQIHDILRRWQQPGDVTDVPRVTTFAGVGQNNLASSRFVHDVSYLRVKNVTLSYVFPKTLIQNWGINNLRMYLTGTNLFTFTDFTGPDPEVAPSSGATDGRINGNLSQVRMFLAGITLAF